MRRRISASLYALEPLLNPVPWLLIAALGLAIHREALIGVSASAWIGVMLGGVALKCAADGFVARRLGRPAFSVSDLAWIPIKDLAISVIWAVGAVKRTVNWRGNQLRIGRGSALETRGTPAELAPEALEVG
jgi:hypothetical protein